MKIHLIAIGGAAMHNIALDLNLRHEVTGSDDEIYDPSLSRLRNVGLLPEEMGWFPNKITKDLDVVILGMHAKIDNPELLKAQELGIPVLSYPEFIFQQSKSKKRIVVAGSHGKTTTTSMILHVLQKAKLDFDYLVGAQIQGFERMVKLSDAEIIVLEGDEYLSSPLDRSPKMLHYKPDIAVITGIAWDHINVFPIFDDYKNQFRLFIESIEDNGHLFYYKYDIHLRQILADSAFANVNKMPYEQIDPNGTEMRVFGKHNLENMEAARLVCERLGINKTRFLSYIKDFSGAGKRLELLLQKDNFHAYLDFAHAPSKVAATVNAIRSQFPNRKIFAFFELHTFSSLNKEFLPHYKQSLSGADEAFVFYDPHTLKMKNMPALKKEEVLSNFDHPNLRVLDSSQEVLESLKSLDSRNAVLLMMTSGKFGKLKPVDLIEDLFG